MLLNKLVSFDKLRAPINHETYMGDLGLHERIILKWIFSIKD
jgi:hypothetical protein